MLPLIRASDIVVTNPPFSLFRSFVEHVVRFKKKFLLVGNMATIGSKAIEHLVMTRQLWFGYFSGAMEFTLLDHYQEWMREEVRPDGSIQKFATVSSICWATNLDVRKPLGHRLIHGANDDFCRLPVLFSLSILSDITGSIVTGH